MSWHSPEPRRVLAVRFNDRELAYVDALVEAAQGDRNWPKVTRSDVIRDAIAERHTLLEQRNTETPASRNTKRRRSRASK